MTAQPTIQVSFNSGEWAPALNARVDLQQYRNAAELLENFFIDYRGGASTRPGTKYCLQAKDSANPVRLIPFQASFDAGYACEFGQNYIRFYADGAPVLETGVTITGATKATPCVVTAVAHGYAVGDWVYISGVVGMTQLNGRFFRVVSTPTADTFGLGIVLDGSNVNSSAYTTYSSAGTVQRVYTIGSPYLGSQLAQLKFSQNVDQLVICHPDYPPYILQYTAETNWTIAQAAFNSTVSAPGNQAVATTLSAGNVSYAYVITAVDINGQESLPSSLATLASKQDLRTTAGTNTISWDVVSGAVSYNVYKTQVSYTTIPTGMQFGFIGNTTGDEFIDSNISPDFSFGPPVSRSPFVSGGSVVSTTITAQGTGYTTTPDVTFTAPSAGGVTAQGTTIMEADTVAVPFPGVTGVGYAIGQTVTLAGGIILTVATLGGPFGTGITSVTLTNRGAIIGAVPTSPLSMQSTSGGGLGGSFTVDFRVKDIFLTQAGSGYATAPTVTFSAGAATATATISTVSGGNPAVPCFFQQRLVLANLPQGPQVIHMSQTGAPFNFNISDPIQDNDAISASLVSGVLSNIRSMVPQPAGLLVFGDRNFWVVNGGQPGSAVTPASFVANVQSYSGASDVPPIIANSSILFVQAKGSVVRDAQFNFYTNVYTGEDISILSSHLFYGKYITEWAWSEEPFKIAWVIRNDGVMLSLTYMKEQKFFGWTHHITDGDFKSVCSVTEGGAVSEIDAVYLVVERVIDGDTVKYIELLTERIYPDGLDDAWCVDSGLRYDGTPATSFTGGEHLAGETVTGLADGEVITPFVMNAAGTFTLPTAASVVTVGLPYTCKLKTLALDLGEPTVQGKRKQITGVTVRVMDTLGLEIGRTFDTLVPMKDLVEGNVGSATNEVVAGLQTCDARTIIDASWTVPGQYCIEQSSPLPATILGVIPEIVIGDTKGKYD